MLRAPMLLLALTVAAGACIPSEDATPGRTPTASPDARPGGTIRVAVTPPDGIDPGNAHEPSGELITRTMCDQLIAFDPVTGEPRPALAESWTITPGGRRLFVKLRRDAVFSDGTPVRADDVAFTLSRVASQRYASRSASLLAPIAGFPFIHGDAEAPNERARRELAGVTAADDRTVEIVLTEPRADFFRVLGHAALTPVSRAAVEADEATFARAPVCAGPYAVAEPWEPGETIALERSAAYHAEHPAYTRGGAGYADRIEFVPVDDPARAGDVDLARAPGASGRGVVSRAGPRVELLGLPNTTPPFDARDTRVAFSMALDREALAAAPPTSRAPASGFVPAAVDDVHRAGTCGANAPARGDVEGARGRLRDAGIDLSGTEITIAFNDELGNRTLARAIADQWEVAFGVTVTLRPITFEQLLRDGQGTQGLKTPFRFGWAPTVSSAEFVLDPLFSFTSIGVDNLSRFGSGDFTDALADARKASNDDDRVAAYQRAEDIVCDEMPMIPISVDVETWRASPSLGSAVDAWLDATSAAPILREIWARA